MGNTRDRRHEITIMANKKVKNALGHYDDNWDDIMTVWASKENLIGREYFTAQQSQSGVTTKFETEYVEGIKRDMRVRCDNTIYEIEAANDLKGLNRDLLLLCKEVVQ